MTDIRDTIRRMPQRMFKRCKTSCPRTANVHLSLSERGNSQFSRLVASPSRFPYFGCRKIVSRSIFSLFPFTLEFLLVNGMWLSPVRASGPALRDRDLVRSLATGRTCLGKIGRVTIKEPVVSGPSGCSSARLERLPWAQEAGGSNPLTPTKQVKS